MGVGAYARSKRTPPLGKPVEDRCAARSVPVSPDAVGPERIDGHHDDVLGRARPRRSRSAAGVAGDAVLRREGQANRCQQDGEAQDQQEVRAMPRWCDAFIVTRPLVHREPLPQRAMAFTCSTEEERVAGCPPRPLVKAVSPPELQMPARPGACRPR